MAGYVTARDLKNDILFRAGESQTSSAWNDKAMDYLNRVYKPLCMGSSEFLPEYVDDWWWMRRKGVLTLNPVQTGTINVTNRDTDAFILESTEFDLSGWRIRIDDTGDIFNVVAHTAFNSALTLDSPYTGPTGTARPYTAMRVEYPLAADVAALMSPMTGYRHYHQIVGVTPERMDELFPLSGIASGGPMLFSLEDDQTVRFSHGGLDDGTFMRLDYRYKPMIVDLTDSDASIPLVPITFRHILSDMALVYLLNDKNDNRAVSMVSSAKATLTAMFRENRRRLVKMDGRIGWIYTRQGNEGYGFGGRPLIVGGYGSSGGGGSGGLTFDSDFTFG